jgi:predicted hydrocarbon binding protein
MSEARQQQVLNFEIPLDETTFEDILFNTARAFTGTFYGLLAIIEERYGKEAAQEIATEMGYRGGRRNVAAWLAANGVDRGSAELMSKYQDFAHAMRGPDHANAIATYDEHVCEVTRRRCGWHTGRPDGMNSYCIYISRGFIDGYKESDPGVAHAEIRKCMSLGDDFCRHVFTYESDASEAGGV